jgi:hypothetical protein
MFDRQQIIRILQRGFVAERSRIHGGGFYVVALDGTRDGIFYTDPDDAEEHLAGLRADAILNLGRISPSEDLLTNDEAANILGIRPNTLEIWRHKGKGPKYIKLGTGKSSPIRYRRTDIQVWMNQ